MESCLWCTFIDEQNQEMKSHTLRLLCVLRMEPTAWGLESAQVASATLAKRESPSPGRFFLFCFVLFCFVLFFVKFIYLFLRDRERSEEGSERERENPKQALHC